MSWRIPNHYSTLASGKAFNNGVWLILFPHLATILSPDNNEQKDRTEIRALLKTTFCHSVARFGTDTNTIFQVGYLLTTEKMPRRMIRSHYEQLSEVGRGRIISDGRSPVPRDCNCNFYICLVVVYKERNFLGASLTPPKRVTCSHAWKKALHP
ncbi:hypothetical protein TNCV_613571 [Trichonephila clavipes]|nr:hypothetical protein TNCV_613571 [Trichonephila clavipes]